MTKVEAVLLWCAIWFYGIGFLLYLYGVVFRRDSGLRSGWHLTISAFFLQSASIGIRWIETGHPPVIGVYENSMLGSWFIIVLFMAVRMWQKRVEVISIGVLPVVLMMIGSGIMGGAEHEGYDVHYKSVWLWFHVFFAWVAYGAFCMGAVFGGLYLLKERAEKKGKKGGFLDRLPEKAVINDLTLKVIIFGFVALTVEIGAGALWAYDLWGRYWGWDPIETWSLITWLTYGTYIHLGVTLGWKGRRMAWLAIFAIIFEFITFGGIGYIGGIHTPIF